MSQLIYSFVGLVPGFVFVFRSSTSFFLLVPHSLHPLIYFFHNLWNNQYAIFSSSHFFSQECRTECPNNIYPNCKKQLAQWIRLHLPSCSPGFESQAHHLSFYQLVFELSHAEKTKLNKKRQGLAHLKNHQMLRWVYA